VRRSGQPWVVRVTGNWRITFGWEGPDAVEVDLDGYH
jgi:proteic killer suppression protein